MNAAIRFSCMAIAVMLLALVAGTRTATAQCTSVTVFNHSTVAIDIKLVGATFTTNNLHLNAGTDTAHPTSGQITMIPGAIVGVKTVGGNNRAFSSGTPQLASHVSLDTGGGCFDVYFDASTCTVDIYMTTTPPPCLP